MRTTLKPTQGSASADHTTLLLNCYAKLRDGQKLDAFVKATDAGGRPALSFDVDTAVKVRVLVSGGSRIPPAKSCSSCGGVARTLPKNSSPK